MAAHLGLFYAEWLGNCTFLYIHIYIFGIIFFCTQFYQILIIFKRVYSWSESRQKNVMHVQ